MVKSISNDLVKQWLKATTALAMSEWKNDKDNKKEDKKTEGNEHIEKAVTSIASTMEKFMEKSIENGKEITDNFSSINKSIESLNERLETFEKSNSDGDEMLMQMVKRKMTTDEMRNLKMDGWQERR